MSLPITTCTNITHGTYDMVVSVKVKAITTYLKRLSSDETWCKCDNLSDYNTLLDLA